MIDKSGGLEIRPLDPHEPLPQDIVPDFPSSLKDFGEIPSGFVPVYTFTPYRLLKRIGKEGLRTGVNQGDTRSFNEPIFRQERPSHIKVDRTQCIYAVPNPPQVENEVIPNFHRVDCLEAMVDPKKVIVVDVTAYDEARKLRDQGSFGADNEVREKAREYWSKAVTLDEFQKVGNESLRQSYKTPEVLISEDIPLYYIRLYRIK